MEKLAFPSGLAAIDKRTIFGAVIVVSILLLLPVFLTGYWINFLAITFMYIALAQSWNIFSGYSGYWSFGHQAFFGIGAFTVGILVTKNAFNPYHATLLGGFLSFLFAVALGLVLLRIKGPYFAISSLVIAEILKVVAINEEWLTGGGNGILLPPIYALHPFYYVMLITLLSVTILAYVIKWSSLGYALFAIRDDETAAETCGIHSTKYKVLIFAVSTFFAGIIGGSYAWFITFIDPYSSFDSTIQLMAMVATVFGGIGRVMGPIMGGFIFISIMEALWFSLPYIYLIILGVSLLLTTRFLPNGVIERLERSKQLKWLLQKIGLQARQHVTK